MEMNLNAVCEQQVRSRISCYLATTSSLSRVSLSAYVSTPHLPLVSSSLRSPLKVLTSSLNTMEKREASVEEEGRKWGRKDKEGKA